MFVELNREEQTLLAELVEMRLAELGSEIRRSRTHEFHDKLKGQKETLQKILRHLHEAEWDVTT